MSDLVDRWVEKLIDTPNIGTMTHSERLEKAFNLEEPDLVPIAPELDFYQIIHGGYDFLEVWSDHEKATNAVLQTWADLRTDLIWPYTDASHFLERFLDPGQRATAFDLRDGKSNIVFKEVAPDLDDCIKIFESKPWAKYGAGRADTHWGPHFQQLLEFQRKMGGKIGVCGGVTTTTNVLDFLGGVQNFIRWTVTEPKEKLHYLMGLVTQERLDALDACRPLAEEVEVWCMFAGGRTFGPRQLEEFGVYDRLVFDKAASIFKYCFFHLCGNNLPYAVDLATTYPFQALQYDEVMQQLGWSWAKWTEWVARVARGKTCAMNAPTCQACAYRTPAEIETMVKEFIDHTTPHTAAVIMPGCVIPSMAPRENVQAMVDAGRKWGKYPECKTRAEQVWTEAEFQESLTRYGAKIPQAAYNWRKSPGGVPAGRPLMQTSRAAASS
ncbi:MAG: hypothetical protein M1358_00720 [Chloroflexi bacterium]|nr:hypothetical protein [Chloroflexota bacterium]